MGKLRFPTCCKYDEAQFAQNRAHVQRLGIPRVESAGAHGRKLAVVGGGSSINQHIETLGNWDGEIWAINGAFNWCKDHGIEAVFLTVDPAPYHVRPRDAGDRALLADHCDITLTDPWARQARVFTTGYDAIVSGPTSASAAPHLAITMGYGDITLFGCECSWEGESHAYVKPEDELEATVRWRLGVECGGQEFITCAEFILQAEYLAAFIHAAPAVIKQESGGLLRAMVEHGDYDIVKIPRWMSESLRVEAA